MGFWSPTTERDSIVRVNAEARALQRPTMVENSKAKSSCNK